MIKWQEDYWKPFEVKSIEVTKRRHAKKIKKAKDISYNEIVNVWFERDVIQRVISGSPEGYGRFWFSDIFLADLKVDKKGALMKSSLNQLKSTVNYATRAVITERLISCGYPKSWDTAFYMTHYNKINALMKRIMKRIIKEYI